MAPRSFPSPNNTPTPYPTPPHTLRACGACACETGRVRARVSWNELRMEVGGALRETALLSRRRRPIGCVHRHGQSVRRARSPPPHSSAQGSTHMHTRMHTHTQTRAPSVDHVFFRILMPGLVVYLALLSGSLRIVPFGDELLLRCAVRHIRTVSGPSPGVLCTQDCCWPCPLLPHTA